MRGIKSFLACAFCLTLNLYSQTSFLKINEREMELVPVTIQGADVKAGTYYVPPAMRVFDIVKMASANEVPDLHKIDSRSVRISTDSTVIHIDLLKYFCGDLDQNPFINAGTVIHLFYAVRHVQVYGELQGSVLGKVPIKSGETAGELLSLYTFNSSADSGNIILFRSGQGSKSYSFSEIASHILKDGDVITVLPKKEIPRYALVKVSGEAASPGIYPVFHGKTTLSEIIEQAGGASPKGDITRAYLIRKAKFQKKNSSQFNAGLHSIRPEVISGYQHFYNSNDYAIIPATENDRVLEDGDEIVIPQVEFCVYVSGCVKNPGAYLYRKDKDMSFYINSAGGYTRFADKVNVKVITPFTGDAFSIRATSKPSSGDIIVVPEVQEDKWIKRWTPVISAAAAVVSSISIVVGLIGIKD